MDFCLCRQLLKCSVLKFLQCKSLKFQSKQTQKQKKQTKDLHLKFSCFCLMPLYKQVTFMLCRGSLFQQLLNYFANFALWTKFTNRNCCLQNSIFFCSLFCQSKQKNSWTSFSSVHSLKKLLFETNNWKVLNKNWFLMKERNLIVYLKTHTCSSFCKEAVPMSYLSLLLFSSGC